MTILSAAELISLGRQARFEKRLADAKNCFVQAVDHIRKTGDKSMLSEALCGLGQIERDQGNTSVALAHYSEAVDLRRTAGDTPMLAHTIRHIADILREQGSPDKAAAHYQKALAIYRSHAETSILDLANAIRGYALLQGDSGNTDDAILLWHEAADLYQQAGVPAGVAESQSNLAFLQGR